MSRIATLDTSKLLFLFHNEPSAVDFLSVSVNKKGEAERQPFGET